MRHSTSTGKRFAMVGAGAGGGDKSRRLCLKEMGLDRPPPGSWSTAPRRSPWVRRGGRPAGVPAELVALGQPALSLLDVLPVVQHATLSSHIPGRPQVRTSRLQAAGAVKPTSVDSVTRIENSLVVIAHLSEGIARHCWPGQCGIGGVSP